MLKPIISIIVPVYNVEGYLEKTLLSILNQSFANFELIIIDDSSTDSSAAIAEKFAQQDRRIILKKLTERSPGGAGYPSNQGLELAQGDYILFVDSDDWLELDALEYLHASAAENISSDIIMMNFDIFLADKNKFIPSYADIISWKHLNRLQELEPESYEDILIGLSEVPWRKLYKSSFLHQNNIRYNEGAYVYEDMSLNWSVMTKQPKISFIDKTLYHHRMGRAGQTINTEFMRKLNSNIYQIKTIQANLIAAGIFAKYKLSWQLYTAKLYSLGVGQNFSAIKNIVETIHEVLACAEAPLVGHPARKYAYLNFILWCFYKRQYWLLFLLSRFFPQKLISLLRRIKYNIFIIK